MRLTDRSLIATLRIAALMSGLLVTVLLWPYGVLAALFIGLFAGVAVAGMLAIAIADLIHRISRD